MKACVVKTRLWRETADATTRIIPVGSMGEPATNAICGADGSTESNHRGAEPGDRAGSGEVSRRATSDDPSRVGALTALAFVLILGKKRIGFIAASRWRVIWGWYRWKTPAAIGDGSEHITKQGSSILRFLLVEAAQVTVRSVPEWRSKYFHLTLRRGRKIAKVAMARKLAVCLYWMWRKGWNYEQVRKFGSHAGQPGNRHGVQ